MSEEENHKSSVLQAKLAELCSKEPPPVALFACVKMLVAVCFIIKKPHRKQHRVLSRAFALGQSMLLGLQKPHEWGYVEEPKEAKPQTPPSPWLS